MLQLSLVAFLLFRRSSLALLLAEAIVAVTLIMSGIGEGWMLDLIVIMGLLFLITSLSQRSKKVRYVGSYQDDVGEEREDPRHSAHHAAAQTAALAKIIIFFIQSLASLVPEATWPSWVAAAMKGVEAVNLRLSGVECFAPGLLSSPVGKLLFHLGLPWIIGANLTIAAVISAVIIKIDPVSRIRSCFQNRRARVGPTVAPSDEEEESTGLLYADVIQDPPETTRTKKSWTAGDLAARVQFSFLFLVSASYFELTNAVLEVLTPCNKGHMANFQWIPCVFTNMEFKSLFIAASAFLIVYTIGIPSLFATLLFRNRRRILAGDPQLESKYGFLYESYKPRFFWFELVWFLRRVLLSSAVTLLTNASGYQMAAIFCVLQGSILLNRYLKPFQSGVANLLDMAASSVILLAVTVGFVVNKATRSAAVTQNGIFSLSAGLALLLFFFLVLPAIQSIKRKCWKKRIE